MSNSIANTPVGRLVTEYPAIARVFEQLGIDYCCQGRHTLSDACVQRGLNLNEILTQISQTGLESSDSAWKELGPSELADHIVAVHHAYLRTEFPRLAQIFMKVIGAHGDRHPELIEAQRVFLELRKELEQHMQKEERVLFPIVRDLANSRRGPLHCGSVSNPIRAMEHEHDVAGELLRDVRRLTNEFVPPADACPTFRVLLVGLLAFEQDLHLHIHKENNVLFPLAAELERAGGPQGVNHPAGTQEMSHI